MTVETEGEVVEQVQTSEQAAKAFAAGFDDDEDKQTTTPAAEVAKPAGEEKQPEHELPRMAQITEAQFNDLMTKVSQIDDGKRQIDALNGHLGGMKQVVEGLKQQRKSLTPGQLKRVSAEYPELAEALQSDLSELSGATVDPVEIDKRVETAVEARVGAVSVAFETKLLRFYHRDWEQVANSPDFIAWKGALPAEELAKLNDSNDGEYIADKLTEFKAAKATKDKAATEAAAKAQTSNSRQKRLEAAVQPRGTGGHSAGSAGVPSDFQAGWDSA